MLKYVDSIFFRSSRICAYKFARYLKPARVQCTVIRVFFIYFTIVTLYGELIIQSVHFSIFLLSTVIDFFSLLLPPLDINISHLSVRKREPKIIYYVFNLHARLHSRYAKNSYTHLHNAMATLMNRVFNYAGR